jgi:hypothetical protein
MGAADGVVRLHWSARALSQFDRLSPGQVAETIRKLAAEGRRAKALVLLEQAFVMHPRDPHLVAVNRELAPLGVESPSAIDPTVWRQSMEALLAVAAAHVPRPTRVALLCQRHLDAQRLRPEGVTDLLHFDDVGDWRCTRVFDLMLCVEYAQHVPPDDSVRLVRSLCERSLRVVFSAALPRQSGSSHINCRSQHDWIELFATFGFTCLDAFRPLLWQATHVAPAVRQNAFLMVRRDLRGEHPHLQEPTLLDVYHPLLVNERVCQDARSHVLQDSDLQIHYSTGSPV